MEGGEKKCVTFTHQTYFSKFNSAKTTGLKKKKKTAMEEIMPASALPMDFDKITSILVWARMKHLQPELWRCGGHEKKKKKKKQMSDEQG